jgi:hypothetical protein
MAVPNKQDPNRNVKSTTTALQTLTVQAIKEDKALFQAIQHESFNLGMDTCAVFGLMDSDMFVQKGHTSS